MTSSPMRHLIVGAGAVGQAYGIALQQAGHTVTVLARPRQIGALEAGVPVTWAGWRRRTLTWKPAALLTNAAAVTPGRFDAVWLCVPTPALTQGTWLSDLCARAGGATVVVLQPGLAVDALFEGLVPPSRRVTGLIALMSWEGPLAGEPGPPGVHWWLPPGVSCTLGGEPKRTAPLAQALSDGGLRTRAMGRDAVARQGAFGSAILTSLVAGLEVAGWSFSRTGREQAARIVHSAREAAAVTAAVTGTPTPGGLRLLAPWLLRLALWWVPRLAPIPLEAFFAAHFRKVGAQTRDALATTIALGEAHGVPTPSLQALLAALPPGDDATS